MRFLKSVFRLVNKLNKMSIFTQARNPITGTTEWVCQDVDYDYHQEVARSAFADMLHDSDRNQKYYAAIKKAVKKLHDNGKEAHVLDIGTGTGILSMMAVKAGADSVIACEGFLPMAKCAEKIIKANGMADKIKVVKKRSQEMFVGEKGDLKQPANLLVTEIFDTELIGEGAISVFNHAHQALLERDAIIIPNFATIYVQVIESPLAYSWSKLKPLADLDGDILLKPSHVVDNCKGEPAVHDIQLSQLDHDQFKVIAGPVPIFEFDWRKHQRVCEQREVQKVVAKCTAVAQVIFFWWELKMDDEGDIILSCAPYWAHPDFEEIASVSNNSVPLQNVIPWRDHWMQAVYYLPKAVMVAESQNFLINGHHDEWSFWFTVSIEECKIPRIYCSCEAHTAFSRHRIGQMNYNLRNKKYLGYFEEMLSKSSKVLASSSGSLLCLASAKMGIESLTIVEEHTPCARILGMYIKSNDINNVKIVENAEELDDLSDITHVIAEPYYVFSILPWDNFYFGTFLNKIKGKVQKNVEIMPVSASIYAMPVEFLDLHKIKSPLGICEGFDLSIFDKYIEDSSELADATVEPQPLWEYPCKALSLPCEILKVDFRNFMENKNTTGAIKIEKSGSCNGVALWVDWKIRDSDNPKYIVSTGPQVPVELGNWVKWDMYTKQGVHLFSHSKTVTEKNSVKWRCFLNPIEGEISFRFEREQLAK